METVCVRWGMLPASIIVAPNSPSARAKARIVPAITLGIEFGNVTRKKSSVSDIPSVRPAFRRFSSICSNAPLEVRYIKGKETTVDAITAPVHEKMTDAPILSSSWPIMLFLPNIMRRKKPTTVGGSTSGRVNRPSKTPFPYFSFTVS